MAALVGLALQASGFERAMRERLAAQAAAAGALDTALREHALAARFVAEDQPRLLALRDQGVLGAPPRLRLLGVLRQLQSAPGLGVLSWELAVPRAMAPQPGATAPAFDVTVSTLALRATLAAPTRLSPLLAQLRHAAGGLSRTTACVLDPRVDGQVDARCEIDWLSVPLPANGAAR